MTDEEVLSLALANFNEATRDREIPDYGRWQAWAREMRRSIGTFSSTTEALRFAQNPRKTPFAHREDYNIRLIHACGTIIPNEFPWFQEKFKEIWDDERSLPGSMTSWVGRAGSRVSDIHLWHTWTVLTCQTYIQDARKIIDIGGGYGAVARLWCLYFPVDRYVIVDLPETLYFAETALRPIFGDEVGYLLDETPDTKIILVPVDRLERYKEACDLVISIGSMQEMNDGWVNYYMKWLDDCGAEYFYSLNYAGQPVDYLRESRCLWGPRPSPQWTTKLLNLDPTVIRIMCFNRNFLEAIYQKTGHLAQGRLDMWSVLRGRSLTTATYLEGLDLIRQHPSRAGIELFMEIVLNNWPNADTVPKEMLALAKLVDCPSSKTVMERFGTGLQGLVA
jgi:putative sugar O-methyltransferase